MLDGANIDWTQVSFVDEVRTEIVLRAQPYRSIMEIKRAVARRYKIRIVDLEGHSRKRCFAWPRQMAMALAYRHGYSLTRIAQAFGNRDHSTVIFAAKKWGHKPDPVQSRNCFMARCARTDSPVSDEARSRHLGVFA